MDKNSVEYFMTKMTQEEFENRMVGRDNTSYDFNRIQPKRSKREDFGFYGIPIIDQLFDDEGNFIQGCGALNTQETE